MNLSGTIGASFSPSKAMKTFLLRSPLLQSSIHSAAIAAAAAAKGPSKSTGASQIPNPHSVAASSVASPRLPSSWPRPSEVPWQPKVANAVKVVGYVASPVRLDISPNGIYRATSVLKQEKRDEFPQFWIPIIFEGDLAQVAACHLRQSDLVYVTGQLSGGSHLLNVQNEQTRIQVNPKFPDFKHKKTELARWIDSAPAWVLVALEGLQFDVKKRQNVNLSSKVSVESTDALWKDLVENPSKWWDNRVNKRNPKGPDFKHKVTGEGLWISNKMPVWAVPKLPTLAQPGVVNSRGQSTS